MTRSNAGRRVPEENRSAAAGGCAADPVIAMLPLLDTAALEELERALLIVLHPADDPRERRRAELGCLAALLAEFQPRPGSRVSYISRETYDELRSDDAPHSARLVERYGSWRAACWHAYGLLPDGRWLGPSRPWPTPGEGQVRVLPYTREEVLDSIRRCERALRRIPSSSDYFRWLHAKRRLAHERGQTLRLAGQSAIYRHFPVADGGWNAALRASREEGQD
jgi:hypothetical protein